MKIEVQVFSGDYISEYDFIQHYNKTYVLLDIDQNIIGYYMWYPENDYAYLYSLAVDKYYQGNGYSKLMLEHFLTTSGYDQHCLHVNPNNKIAIRLYDKNKFMHEKKYNKIYKKQFFTDDDINEAKQLFKQSGRKYFLFLCDMRDTTDDQSVYEDIIMQQRWIIKLGCHAFSVKFRFPFVINTGYIF
jgi:ribosomal protein S18 acetylase RimI-like enzyme